MKILLLGKNGQIGWELQRSLSSIGELVSLDRNNPAPLCGDLSNLEQLAQTIRTLSPDVIVNAAAYTAVDKAESERYLAMRINGEAPEVLAREAALIGAWLVHYSTDYVFNGNGTHFWQEKDPQDPLNLYGKSKLQGELAIQSSGCKHIIFRTSWVYGLNGNNFIKNILRLAQERDILKIVDDQIGAPTGAELLADVTAQAIKIALQNAQVSGLYHLVPTGEISWYELAQFVIGQARSYDQDFQCKAIHPIRSSEYPTLAKRPLNSRLNTSKLTDVFSFHLPDWQKGVNRMLHEVFRMIK